MVSNTHTASESTTSTLASASPFSTRPISVICASAGTQQVPRGLALLAEQR